MGRGGVMMAFLRPLEVIQKKKPKNKLNKPIHYARNKVYEESNMLDIRQLFQSTNWLLEPVVDTFCTVFVISPSLHHVLFSSAALTRSKKSKCSSATAQRLSQKIYFLFFVYRTLDNLIIYLFLLARNPLILGTQIYFVIYIQCHPQKQAKFVASVECTIYLHQKSELLIQVPQSGIKFLKLNFLGFQGLIVKVGILLLQQMIFDSTGFLNKQSIFKLCTRSLKMDLPSSLPSRQL